MITYLSVLTINSILLLQNRLSRLKYLPLLLFFVLLVFSGHNPDYDAYERTFLEDETFDVPFKEAWAMLFMFRLIRMFGIKSYRFSLIIVGLFIFFVFYRWSKLSRNITFVVYIYMLFIAFYDIIQIRNAILSFLTVYSLLLLLEGKNKLAVLIPCIIAPFFHVLGVFTLVLMLYIMFIKPRQDYSLSRIELIMLFVIGVVAATGKVFALPLAKTVPFLWKIELYLTDSIDIKSFIIWLVGSALQLLVLWFFCVKTILSPENNTVSVTTKKSVNILYRYALFAIPLLGTTLWMDEIVRIFRLFFLVMFLLYAVARDELDRKNRLIVFGTFSLVNLAYMIAWMIRGINPDRFWG